MSLHSLPDFSFAFDSFIHSFIAPTFISSHIRKYISCKVSPLHADLDINKFISFILLSCAFSIELNLVYHSQLIVFLYDFIGLHLSFQQPVLLQDIETVYLQI